MADELMVCVFKWRELLQAPFPIFQNRGSITERYLWLCSKFQRRAISKSATILKSAIQLKKREEVESAIKAVELKASHQQIDNKTLF